MCGCEHHMDRNAPCTCRCPEHEAVRREMADMAQAQQERDDLAALMAERDALASAVDRVRRRHPRGDEETGVLAPGLWCPTCGHERTDNGYGACPDRLALVSSPAVQTPERPGEATD